MEIEKNTKIDNVFNDAINTRFGCIMFDLLEDSNGKYIPMPGSGWASIEGATAYRIKNTSELSNDVKWLTNLSQEVLWKTGAVTQTKLKHSGYLRTDVGQIMKEVGLVPPKTPIANVCESISEIFTKVMKLAIEFYDVKSFNQKELHTEIKDHLNIEDKNISSYVDEALIRAYQDLVICEKVVPKDKSFFITLKRPRYYHAKSILETSIPVWEDDWEFFGPDDLPTNNEEKIDFLMKKERPFVAKIGINTFTFEGKINVDLSKLLNLGEAIGEGGKTKDRNWVCQPELLYLRRFADVNIDAAFVAKSYIGIEEKVTLPYLGELSDFSYSLGLLAESVWIGLSTRSVNPQTRSKTLVSPRACWLKASDRFMTLTSAMMLSSAGFEVASYGYGGVTVLIEEENIASLMDIAPHAGLSVPVNIIEKVKVNFERKENTKQ